MSYHELLRNRAVAENRPIVIDNVEMFLNFVAREAGANGVSAATMTPGVRINLATREGWE